jgi:hypothetical protein
MSFTGFQLPMLVVCPIRTFNILVIFSRGHFYVVIISRDVCPRLERHPQTERIVAIVVISLDGILGEFMPWDVVATAANRCLQ